MIFLSKKIRFFFGAMMVACLFSCQANTEPELINPEDSVRLSNIQKHQDAEGHKQSMIDFHAGSRSVVKLTYSHSGQVTVGQEVHVPLVFTTSQTGSVNVLFSQQPAIQLLSSETSTLAVNDQGQVFYELIFIPAVAGKHYIKFMLNMELAEQGVVQMMSIPVYVADSEGQIPVKIAPDVKQIDLPLRQF